MKVLVFETDEQADYDLENYIQHNESFFKNYSEIANRETTAGVSEFLHAKNA